MLHFGANKEASFSSSVIVKRELLLTQTYSILLYYPQCKVQEVVVLFLGIYMQINTLQARLNEVQPQIIDCLESLVDPKLLSADRSKLHLLLLNNKR